MSINRPNSELLGRPVHSQLKKKQNNKGQTFIPIEELLKKRYSDQHLITQNDIFLSHNAFKTFSSLFSNEDDKLPKYMVPYKDFINKVTDFSDAELNEINKCQIEKEKCRREAEQLEAKAAAEKERHELVIKNSLDDQVTKLMLKHKFFVKRTCPVKIPFKSTLNHKQHEFYLRSFIKFQIRPYQTKHEEEEYNQYVSMQNRLFDEQNCLMNFSYKVAQLSLNEYNTVPPIQEKYIKDRVSHRCQRVFAYPQYYRQELKIPIKPQDPVTLNSNFQLKHIGHLLSLGVVPLIRIPYPDKRNNLPINEVVSNKRPAVYKSFDRNLYLYKCNVSEDPNAEFLALQHNVHIVMSASAFKVIVDNQVQPFDNYWNIPVTIKSHTITDTQGKKKEFRVIYIDKPLVKKSWYPLEMKSNFFKQSALAHLTNIIGHYDFKMKTPVVTHSSSRERIENIYTDDIFDSPDESVPDFFESTSFASSSPSDTYKNMKSSKRKFSPKIEESSKKIKTGHRPNLNSTKERDQWDLEDDLFLTDEDEEESLSSPKKLVQSTNPLQPLPKDIGNAKPLGTTQISSLVDFQASTSQKKDVNSQAINDSKNPEIPCPSATNESHGFLDNLLDSQNCFLKLKSEGHLNYNQCSSSTTPSLIQIDEKKDNNYKKNWTNLKPWSNTIFTDWSKASIIKQSPNESGTNVHYQLFSFENANISASKTVSEPLRIIVRHNIHGMTNYKKKSIRPSKAYVVYPKMENQVFFGAEVNSYSEISQQWASLIVRPNTTLLQIRACVESGSVVLCEERTLETILKEGKQSHIKFDPQFPLASLNALFTSLTKMSSGQYMIHHSMKTEAFISLMKAIDVNADISQNLLDIQSIYSDGSLILRQYKVSPWLAIDTHVLTPFHLIHKKIPGTFPMANPDRKLDKKARKRKRAAADKKKSIEDDNEPAVGKPNVRSEAAATRNQPTEKTIKRRYF